MTAERREFLEAVERAKLDAMKELAYGASHEINNPLANISARAQALLRDEAHPERRRALEAIQHQALRAHEMISDLMLFARPPGLVVQSIDAAGVVSEVVAELQGECHRREIELTVFAGGDLPCIEADAVQLAVAVKALVVNAIEAIGRRGRADVTVETLAGGEASACDVIEAGRPQPMVIEVRDNGPGIPAEVLPHIFDPFFSGREAGRGLGFGLSKCWRIVTEHGGRLRVDSPPGGGARVTIELPMTQANRFQDGATSRMAANGGTT